MPTYASTMAAIDAKVDAFAVMGARLSSDLRDDRDHIPAGANRFQLFGQPIEDQPDSNTTYQQMAVELRSLHRLADQTDERTYTEGLAYSILGTIVQLDWWRTITGVHEVVADPTVVYERVGNVIIHTLTIAVSITP